MKWLGLIFLGLLSFVITLAWKFPAAGVLPHVNTQPLQLLGVSGSVWRGSAQKVTNGDPLQAIDNLQWKFLPQTLLGGATGVRVDFEWMGGRGEADVARTLAGEIDVNDALYRVAAKNLQPLIPIAELDGVINAQVDALSLDAEQRLKSTTGEITWRNAKVSTIVDVLLGQVVLTVQPDGNVHRCKLTNKDGQVEIKGDFEIDQQGQYKADIRVKETKSTPPELSGMLGMLANIAKKSSDGSYRIRQSGNISQYL